MEHSRVGSFSSVLMAGFVFACAGMLYAQKPCTGLHCASVNIDHISRFGNGGALKYITASGKSGTYIFSCLWDCQIPVEGKTYDYSEDPPVEGDGQSVYLTGFDLRHAPYSLEVFVPELPPPEVQNLIGQCKENDRFADEVDCGKWIVRKESVLRTACPDAAATSACDSFQQLVRANDRDVMNDFAHQDHVYVCFLPAKDEFFEITFSEPLWSSFRPPDADPSEKSVPSNALTITGGSEFSYYKNGIGVSDKSLHNLGTWTYRSLGEKFNPAAMERIEPSKRASFKGENIEIEGGRWTLSEINKNLTNTETKHTVIVQLATGRFQEDFVTTATGRSFSESSGRCLIVSSEFRH